MLTILDSIPNGLLNVSSNNLYQILDGPTLIHLSGKRKEPLFVSVLLHGNENSGFIAMQKLLSHYVNKTLPRSLSLFIGNIEAAKHSKRHLDGYCDYNRIWMKGEYQVNHMAQRVLDEMKSLNVFASIDIHNNTGINPHYACVTEINNHNLQLANLFSRIVIYFTKPEGTLTKAFTPICPSVTVECGQPGHLFGVDHVYNFLDGCLHLSHLPDTPVHKHDMELYHTVAIIKIPHHATFGFNSDQANITLREDLDHLNFRLLSPGTPLANIDTKQPILFEAWDENGNEVGGYYFRLEHDKITIKKEVMPSMFTLNKEIIRQDCLCYFMERYFVD